MKKSTDRCKRVLHSREKGFTLIEMLVVVAIIAVITGVAFGNFYSRRNKSGELDATTKEIAALLREARSNSVSQASSTGWGVHFDNTGIPFFTLFGGAYTQSSTAQGHYRLPARVQFVTSSVPAGGSLEVSFTELDGRASASTTIGLSLIGNTVVSSSIRVSSSGVVSY